jgi:prepilin-type N-terminal cleavage/methylation domain-containing protein
MSLAYYLSGICPRNLRLPEKGPIMKIRQGNVKGSSGFTIIELLVAMVIFSILAGIAIPAFSVWIPRQRLKNAVRDVYSNMQLAKLEAIRNARDCKVTVDETNKKYTIAVGANTIKEVSLSGYSSDILFGGASGAATSGLITFSARGLATTTGNIYLTNSDEEGLSYRVEVKSAGIVCMYKWNGTDWE